jgi:hypothetical protein
MSGKKINLEGYEHLRDTIRAATVAIDQVLDKESPELHKRLTDQLTDLYKVVTDMNDEHMWDIRDNHDQFDYE